MPGLDDFVGQATVKDLLQSKIRLANATGTALPHLLICGEKEQGKVTFATCIAHEMGVPCSSARADGLMATLDLTGLLSNVRARQILIIDEVDALRPSVLDYFVQAISTFRVDIMVGAGAGARLHTLPIPKFSAVATTSRPWMVDERIRRWCIPCQFSSYSQREAGEIVLRIAQKKGLPLDTDGATEIAAQCRFMPGEAEIFLQKVSNHFPFKPPDRIDRSMVLLLSEFLGSGNAYPSLLAVADEVRKMGGIEFEHWVAELFKRAGFQVEVTQASGDHGVDLWVTKEGVLVAVQCKRWDGALGEPVLRDLFGSMISGGAQSGCAVTTGSFTAQAEQFAKGKPLHLIGFDSLMQAATSPETLARMFGCG
jgi:HJR/Mrr/RecB family endonuclease